MKLRKFFEEHLRLRKGRSTGQAAAAPPPQQGAAGGARKLAPPHAGHLGFPGCRCVECIQPSGLPRFHASAPASVGVRVDCRHALDAVAALSPDRSSGGGLLGRGVDWIRSPPPPPPAILVHTADNSGALQAADADMTDDGVTADSSWRRTDAEEAAFESSHPEPPPSPEQYNTVPRCRSRIKTNPWIPAPRPVPCPDGGGPCVVWRRQSADTAAAAAAAAAVAFASDSASALLAGDGLSRLLPDAGTIKSEGAYGHAVRFPDNLGRLSGGGSGSESGYATCRYRRGCYDCEDVVAGEDDEGWRLSPRDDYYYDWHDALREAFTPVTRGDDSATTSSVDDVWSSGCLDSDCHRSGGVAATARSFERVDDRRRDFGDVPTPSHAAAGEAAHHQQRGQSPSLSSLPPSPPTLTCARSPFSGAAANTECKCAVTSNCCCCLRCADGDRGEPDDVTAARADSGRYSVDCCRDFAEDGDDCDHCRCGCNRSNCCASDDRTPSVPAVANDVGLAARVRKLRAYDSVLNEKIRLARIECQLILSSLAVGEYGSRGGCAGGGGGSVEEAR